MSKGGKWWSGEIVSDAKLRRELSEIARQAHALIPLARRSTIENDLRRQLEESLREAKRLFPRDRGRQLAYASAQMRAGLLEELKTHRVSTMH